MSPRNRDQRAPRRERPKPQRDDEGDDEATAAPGKPPTNLLLAKQAVEAHWLRRNPTNEQLAGARRGLGPDDPACLIGRIDGRCDRGMGSVNIVCLSRAGNADWRWIARMCEEQRTWGFNLVEPFGGDSTTYFLLVVRSWMLAERELRAVGLRDEAEQCRLAVRSAMAWIAMVTWAGVPRVEDRINEAGKWRTERAKKIDHRLPGTAFAGPRFTTKAHGGGLSTQNACAALLAGELASADDLGLTNEEAMILRLVTAGDMGAARAAALWMFGTVLGWWFRLRRTDVGTEVVYGVDERANPYKPSFAVGQFDARSGALTRMTPARHGVKNDAWGAAEFSTEIRDGGVIYSRCGSGEAEVRELEGDEAWRIDVRGSKVNFAG